MCWQAPDSPLHPALSDVASMLASYILDSLQEPLVSMTLRDLDVNSQGLTLT